MLSVSASDIIIESVTLVISRMFSSTRRRREVCAVIVRVVTIFFVREDERHTVLVLVDAISGQYNFSEIMLRSLTGRTSA
jgi:hypothetical protein